MLIALAAVQSAVAQDIPMSPRQAGQLACISDRLIKADADMLIANVYTRGDTEGDDYDKTVEAMDVAMVGCQVQHGWSDEETNLAASVGMFQIILDANVARFSNSPGVTEAAFQQLGEVLTGLPESDKNILMDGVWRDDPAVLQRLSDRLIAAGIPKDPLILAHAILIMEAKLVVTYGTMDWVKLTP
jgi:hypothetical protein